MKYLLHEAAKYYYQLYIALMLLITILETHATANIRILQKTTTMNKNRLPRYCIKWVLAQTNRW